MGKTTIELRHKFEAAHHLPDSDGLTTKKCLNNHGHTYGVRVKVAANTLADNFVVDFGTIKSVIDELDHAQILWENDDEWIDFFERSNPNMKLVILPYVPTAENLAHYIFDVLEEALPLSSWVESVSVLEGTFYGKEDWVTYEADAQ